MEADAKAYNKVSGPQFEEGCQFIRDLNLSLGNKVLDMGCGTGLITKFIAHIVGSDGLVVGIDPDAQRIKIAKENCKDISNVQFHVGSSTLGFLHENEPYYDYHISTNAFHWVPEAEKSMYIEKAYQCLRPGGQLAILCNGQLPDNAKVFPDFHSLSQVGYRELFKKIGLFNDVVVDNPTYLFKFKSLVEFKCWLKASTHLDIDEFDPLLVETFVTIEDDGQISFKGSNILIIACKN